MKILKTPREKKHVTYRSPEIKRATDTSLKPIKEKKHHYNVEM